MGRKFLKTLPEKGDHHFQRLYFLSFRNLAETLKKDFTPRSLILSISKLLGINPLYVNERMARNRYLCMGGYAAYVMVQRII